MKRLMVIMAAVFALFITQLYSQPDDAKQIQKFMGKLNLTDEQKKDVEMIPGFLRNIVCGNIITSGSTVSIDPLIFHLKYHTLQ